MKTKQKSDKDQICHIVNNYIQYETTCNWKDRRREFYRLLSFYQPTKPEDQTAGFVAFNAGNKRMKTKTGRFLAKKLKLNSDYLNPEQIETLADNINFHLFGDVCLGVKILSGREITRAYYKGVGGSSCMTGSNSKKTGLYADNPDVYKMLVIRLGNNTARAMIVKLDNGRKLLDRVYGDSELIKIAAQSYAKKQGWLYRKSFNHGSCTVCNPDGSIYHGDLTVSNLIFTDGEIPYQDTIINAYISYTANGGERLNLTTESAGYVLDSTDGYIKEIYRCEGCGCDVEEEERYVDRGGYVYCNECYYERYATCDRCGDEFGRDDATICRDNDDIYCPYCRDNYLSFCEDCEEYYKNTTHLDGVNIDVCDHCIDKYIQCENCYDYIHIYDSIYDDDKEVNYCEHCYKNIEQERQEREVA